MNSVEVEFCGGPYDGRRMAVEAGDDECPPPLFMAYGETIHNDGEGTLHHLRMEVTYTRRPSHRSSGPLWLMVYPPWAIVP